MTKIRALLVWCVALLIAACGVDATEDIGSTQSALTATLVSIAVTPGPVSLPAGVTQQFKATGTLSNGKTKNLTNAVTWTATSTSASIDATGLATTSSPGSVTITARDAATNITGSTTLTVDARTVTSVTLAPIGRNIPVDGMQRMIANAVLSDGSKIRLGGGVASWTSNNFTVASIDGTGVVTGVLPGVAVITVTHVPTGLTRSTTITVDNVTLDYVVVGCSVGGGSALPIGQTEACVAVANFSDGTGIDITEFANWSSSNQTVATVDTKGVVTGLAQGKTTIRAGYRGVFSTQGVAVGQNPLKSIHIQPDSTSLVITQHDQLVAIGTFLDGSMLDITNTVTWTSTNTNIFTISNADGEHGFITPINVGAAKARATDPVTGKTAVAPVSVLPKQTVDLAISPQSATFDIGATQAFTVTATYNDQSTADVTAIASFFSGDESVVTLDPASGPGVVTGVGPGTTLVSATITEGNAAIGVSAEVTVLDRSVQSISVEVAPPPNVPKGTTVQAHAFANYNVGPRVEITDSVTWSTTTPTMISVSDADGSKGKVTGLALGSGIVRATDSAGHTALFSVTVTAPLPSALLFSAADIAAMANLKVGATYTLSPQARFTDGTTGPLPATYKPTVSVTPPNLAVVTPNTTTLRGSVVGNGQVRMILPPQPPPGGPVTPAMTTLSVKP